MIPLRFRRFAGAAAAAAWILFGATAVVLLFCGDAALLSREMAAHAPPETTGLPASEYAGVSRMIADYLLGRADRFQYEYAGPSGTPVQCFRPHEEAHMADVRALVRLDRRVMLVSLGAALLLSAAGLAGSRPGLPGPAPAARTGGAEGDAGRPAFWRGVRAGLMGAGLLAAGLAAWAAVDFDGFFVTFHRLAFTNDGWLLDPRTSLLIRLMPLSFFISLGWKGALAALAVPAALAAASGILLRKKKSVQIEIHSEEIDSEEIDSEEIDSEEMNSARN